MPHIILECTDIGKSSRTEILIALHEAALSTGIFEEKTIKTRMRRHEESLVGGNPAQFAHITVYLIDGRDALTKKRLATELHETVRRLLPDAESVSVDVRDLDREIYTKSTH